MTYPSSTLTQEQNIHWNGHSNGNSSANLLARFQTAINNQAFYEAADAVLATIEDPMVLAQCAEQVAHREPGGVYYRAKLWTRTAELLEAQGSDLTPVCTTVGTKRAIVKNYVEQGQVIRAVEQKAPQAYRLRELHPDVFQNAQRQKDQAAAYLLDATTLLEHQADVTPTQIHRSWCRTHGSIKANLDIIKPSDWWAFGHPKWNQDPDFPGSIPGEIYANALYYFAPQQGVAVDPMAGSGMLKRVYDDRDRWQKDLAFDLDVRLFDLYPSRDFITIHDAKQPLPIMADWIFLDAPYFGQSNHLFNGDLAATTDYSRYIALMRNITAALSASLNPGGRFCIFLPKWSGYHADDPNYDVPQDVGALVLDTGLQWIDMAFVSRARQQEPGSAIKNNSAKRERRMRSDTCVLNVYEKPEVPHV